tara:strand:+ start:1782 stop:1958 length:177 start_codon:yes stop_codon:yes gene_type:complete
MSDKKEVLTTVDYKAELETQEKTLKVIENAYLECVGTIKYLKKKIEDNNDSKNAKNSK